jgi:hypothetical protein
MKVVCDMPHIGKNEGEFYINKCNHAKNEGIYLQISCIMIMKQVIHEGLKGERGRNRQQFITILHLL